jgi:hypothetical protein
MNGLDVQRILDRVRIFTAALGENAARGFEYSTRTSIGEEVKYTIRGIRSQEEYRHVVVALCDGTWKLKDHLKNLFETKGLDPDEVEQAVNASRPLQICSDLRNRDEHGKLKKHGRPHSRSTLFAELGTVSFNVPQQSVQCLVLDGPHVMIDTIHPELIECHAPVIAADGTQLGDATQICAEALEAWLSLMKRRGLEDLLRPLYRSL